MPRFTDQMQRTFELAEPPRRIVSLVPSQTELLAHLGVGDSVVGITRFCVRPESWLREKQIVGGTKQLDLGAIRALKPDLILGNKEENQQQEIEVLMREFNIWMSDILTLDDALAMIEAVGQMVDRTRAAHLLGEKIALGFEPESCLRAAQIARPLRAAYLIWRKPYMIAGGSTFISTMMNLCGLHNIFQDDPTSRYPMLEPEQLRSAAPDLILLASEPYPFAARHVQEFTELCPAARVRLADGEIFSWYGPRLLHAPAYFRTLLASL